MLLIFSAHNTVREENLCQLLLQVKHTCEGNAEHGARRRRQGPKGPFFDRKTSALHVPELDVSNADSHKIELANSIERVAHSSYDFVFVAALSDQDSAGLPVHHANSVVLISSDANQLHAIVCWNVHLYVRCIC